MGATRTHRLLAVAASFLIVAASSIVKEEDTVIGHAIITPELRPKPQNQHAVSGDTDKSESSTIDANLADKNDGSALSQHSPDTDNQDFCRGMYTAMFMDGFHFSLGRQKNPPQCLTFMARSWRLSERGKFVGAMVFAFSFALLTEGLSSVRGIIVRNGRKGLCHRALLNLVYALQSTAGYLLMFAAMSFSWELMLSVVAGLMVGNRIFIRYEDLDMEAARQRAARRRSALQGLRQVAAQENPIE